MNRWRADKAWSDVFIPEIKQIVAGVLVSESPLEEDQERNTDLIVLKMETKRIACRVRQGKYLEKYGDEFTIRSIRPNGNKTELAKVIEGWGDYLFYGFAGANDLLVKWTLADLNVFRLWFNGQIVNNKGELPGTEQKNHDGSSLFRCYRWDEFPSGFVVDKSWEFPDPHIYDPPT